MSKMSTAYCNLCKKRVAVRAEGVNHVLHLLLSIVTGGFWLIIWFIWAMLPDDWYCTECGQHIKLDSTKPTNNCPKCKVAIEKDKTSDTENSLGNREINKNEQKSTNKNIWIIVIVYLIMIVLFGEENKSLKHQNHVQNRRDYIQICENAIKARLTYPSTYDKDFLGDEVAPYKDYITVGIWFSAKNAFNLELKYQGTCNFKNGLNVESVLIQEVK